MTRKEIISSAEKVECTVCDKGIQMCRTRPCWGTVSNFRKIIKAGHAKKLMVDYYNNKDVNKGENIYFLSGASRGNECSKADWNPIGICIFFQDNKCDIHGIKPTMGAIGCCKMPIDIKILHACLMTWTTKEGKDLIEKWKKMVDYVEKKDYRRIYS